MPSSTTTSVPQGHAAGVSGCSIAGRHQPSIAPAMCTHGQQHCPLSPHGTCAVRAPLAFESQGSKALDALVQQDAGCCGGGGNAVRQGSARRPRKTAPRKEVWERWRGEGKSGGSAVGPSERGWWLPLQTSRRAGRLLSNICVNRAESQSSPGAVGLQQSRGRAGLALQVCTLQHFGVQPAGPAEQGREVSAFLGHAGPARTARGLPLAREVRRCSLERNCKSLPSAFPFVQRNSCGANIWMLVLIIEVSGEGQHKCSPKALQHLWSSHIHALAPSWQSCSQGLPAAFQVQVNGEIQTQSKGQSCRQDASGMMNPSCCSDAVAALSSGCPGPAWRWHWDRGGVLLQSLPAPPRPRTTGCAHCRHHTPEWGWGKITGTV